MPAWRSAWCPVVLAAPATWFLFVGVAVPGGYYTTLMVGVVGWAVVGLLWLAAGVGYRGQPVRKWWPLLLTPVLLATVWVVASGDLVGRALFPLHRQALERDAALPDTTGSSTVGIYSFEYRFKDERCTFFGTSDPGMALAAGFAWCPGLDPTTMRWHEPYVFESIEGDWYAYVLGRRVKTDGPWGLRLSQLSRRIET